MIITIGDLQKTRGASPSGPMMLLALLQLQSIKLLYSSSWPGREKNEIDWMVNMSTIYNMHGYNHATSASLLSFYVEMAFSNMQTAYVTRSVDKQSCVLWAKMSLELLTANCPKDIKHCQQNYSGC